MARFSTATPANRELDREVSAARAQAADLQRQEARDLIPRGSAEAFRRRIAVAVKTARLAAHSENGIGTRPGVP
jgi:hypothetical protein